MIKFDPKTFGTKEAPSVPAAACLPVLAMFNVFALTWQSHVREQRVQSSPSLDVEKHVDAIAMDKVLEGYT